MMQNEDEVLQAILRAALPPVAAAQPRADVWQRIVARTSARSTWTLADWSVAAVIVVALILFPNWFWFLACHL
jgi:hypothetical protein